MNIAIIPARGGSKRLPGKNIKSMAGKPMISWTIEAALNSKKFDHVFVSTDCKDIAATSKKSGANVPFLRPDTLSTDTATTHDVVFHLINWFEFNYKTHSDTITILQPTSPLRNAKHIREAFQLMTEKSADAIVSVCPVEYPLEFCNKLNKDRSMNEFIKPENIKRTQDMEPVYRLNGAIYLIKSPLMLKQSQLYGPKTYAYIMGNQASVDIDTEEDFDYAEYLMKKSLGTNV